MKRNLTCSAVVLLIAAGCGGAANKYDAVVTGTVTVEGDLAKSGTVIFHPAKEGGLVAIGQIFPDGSYSLRTGQGNLKDVDGGTVQSGEYIVTVSVTGPQSPGAVVAEGGPPIPGPSLIAKKYALKDTSDLRRSVAPGPNVLVLDLEAVEPESTEELEEASAAAGAEAAVPAEEAASEESTEGSASEVSNAESAATSETDKHSAEAADQ